jgi:cell division protein FtsB
MHKILLRWVIWAAGLSAAAYMAWGLVFSDHGYLVYREEAVQLQALQEEVKLLKQERERLAKQILSLRNDPDALEELVHRELGYVHSDEYMLIMPGEGKKTKEEAKP